MPRFLNPKTPYQRLMTKTIAHSVGPSLAIGTRSAAQMDVLRERTTGVSSNPGPDVGRLAVAGSGKNDGSKADSGVEAL